MQTARARVFREVARMCGIAGLIRDQAVTEADHDEVRRVAAHLAHRGPDGEGWFAGAHVVLAMRRLSIIDLAGGWQPLYNEDRTLALVANGEIYNFIELRRDLEARGHRFATGSDCETILHLYEEYGAECVQHLRGMFAFALWDAPRRRLLLARDRMGEKPLFLVDKPGELRFASELKALVRAGCVPFDLEPAAIDAYFHYQYVPDPEAPLRGVRRLPAGHLLLVDVDPWRVQARRYWDMEDAPPLDGDPATLIRAELERISELVVRSDAPVGVALSSGLDSSAIATLAARKYPGVLHAFSVGYPGAPTFDERAQAKELADHLRVPFHEVVVDVPDLLESFPEMVYCRDTPIADLSGPSCLKLMKAARDRGVRVMLQGHGGDELFWGYKWVREAVGATQAKDEVTPADDCFAFMDLVPDYRVAQAQMPGLYTAAFRQRLAGTCPDRFYRVPRPWPRPDLRLTHLICDTYLRENGITQGDRLSMAASVEMRLPLVDYRLVETVIGLRKSRPDHAAPPKAWLRAALAGVVPEWVLSRPKQGFKPPMRQWHQALFAKYGRLLAGGHLVEAGVLSPEAGRALATGPCVREVTTQLSYKALVLELWCRTMTGETVTHARAAVGNALRGVPLRGSCIAASERNGTEAVPYSASSELAPVVLFAYKRPEHTRQTLEALASADLAERSTLYVFCDGPRLPEDRDAVAAVRRVVAERKWTCQVEVVAHAENRGLAGSIIAGVTEVIKRHGRAIVLEDDLLIGRSFLSWMNAALDRYEQADEVMQVSGYLFPVRARRGAFFLPLPTSWGWATWQRAWRWFDPLMTGCERIEREPSTRRRFNLGGAYPYSALLKRQRQGSIDSWAIRWYLSVFLRNGLTLYPPASLVRNIGLDGSGTHTKDRVFDTAVSAPAAPQTVPSFPHETRIDASALADVICFFQGNRRTLTKPSWLAQARAWLRRRILRPGPPG